MAAVVGTRVPLKHTTLRGAEGDVGDGDALNALKNEILASLERRADDGASAQIDHGSEPKQRGEGLHASSVEEDDEAPLRRHSMDCVRRVPDAHRPSKSTKKFDVRPSTVGGQRKGGVTTLLRPLALSGGAAEGGLKLLKQSSRSRRSQGSSVSAASELGDFDEGVGKESERGERDGDCTGGASSNRFHIGRPPALEQRRLRTPAPLASVHRVARPALAVALSRSLQETKTELDQRRVQHGFDQKTIEDLQAQLETQRVLIESRDAELLKQQRELEEKDALVVKEREKAAAAHEKMSKLNDEVAQMKSESQFGERKLHKQIAKQQKEMEKVSSERDQLQEDFLATKSAMERIKLEGRAKLSKLEAMELYNASLKDRLNDLTIKAGFPMERKIEIDDLIVDCPERDREEIMVAQLMLSMDQKVKRIFYAYTKDELTMTRTQFAKFAKDSNVLSRHLTLNKVDIIYAAASTSDSKTSKVNSAIKEGESQMSVGEFQEGIVRLANAYFVDVDSIEAQLRDFMTECLPSSTPAI